MGCSATSLPGPPVAAAEVVSEVTQDVVVASQRKACAGGHWMRWEEVDDHPLECDSCAGPIPLGNKLFLCSAEFDCEDYYCENCVHSDLRRPENRQQLITSPWAASV